MLHQWTQILKSLRKPLTENCFVCEDHFDEDNIIRFYECQLKDGTIHRLQRGKSELRKNAIPVATKILKPVDREINESNNQGSMDMHEENNLTQLCTSNNTCNIDYPHQDHQSLNPQSSTIINDTSTQFDFDTLLSSFSHVPLPSCEWAAIVSKNGNCVTFLTVSDNTFRRVQINDDMSVLIFLDDIQLIIKELSNSPKCTADIADLVKFVDNMKVCDNFKEAKRFL